MGREGEDVRRNHTEKEVCPSFTDDFNIHRLYDMFPPQLMRKVNRGIVN